MLLKDGKFQPLLKTSVFPIILISRIQKKVADSLRQLHAKNLRVGWQFLPWEEAQKIENILRENKAITMKDFDDLKAKNQKNVLKRLLEMVLKKDFVIVIPTLPNWMLTEQKAILIDWEYAGYADPETI